MFDQVFKLALKVAEDNEEYAIEKNKQDAFNLDIDDDEVDDP